MQPAYDVFTFFLLQFHVAGVHLDLFACFSCSSRGMVLSSLKVLYVRLLVVFLMLQKAAGGCSRMLHPPIVGLYFRSVKYHLVADAGDWQIIVSIVSVQCSLLIPLGPHNGGSYQGVRGAVHCSRAADAAR